MKKKNQQMVDTLNQKLKPLDNINPLPQELSQETIARLAASEYQIEQKANLFATRLKPMMAVAAAIVLILCGFSIFNVLNSKPNALPLSNSSATEPKNAENYEEIEKIFSALKAGYDEKNKAGFTSKVSNFFNYNYGGLKESADGAADIGSPVRDENLLPTVQATAEDNSSGDRGSGEGSGSYGKTNTQVANVDEADIVKNDGKYLYIVPGASKKIIIVNPLPVNNLKLVSEIKVGEYFVSNIYVKENKLVAICYKYEQPKTQSNGAVPEIAYDMAYLSTSTHVFIYDISDRANPKEIRRFTQDGTLLSTRMIENRLYVMTNYNVSLANEDYKKKCIPTTTVDNGNAERLPNNDISILPKVDNPEYLVVCGIDIENMDKEITRKAVLGGGSDSYCTQDALYISRTTYDFKEEQTQTSANSDTVVSFSVRASFDNINTELYQFKISETDIVFKNSGKVKGSILNQFSMDEYKGNFRIATTGTNKDGQSTNAVYVLDSALKEVGKVENIAVGEQIYAVRFMGEKGYVVTFERTDPLFVLDLSSPAAPKILGELKIPGFSNYLHPYSENLLIGIGQNGNENGALNGLKISLFDVNNPAKPKEIDSYVIDNANSNAQYDHKAVLASKEKEIIGFPVAGFRSGSDYYMTLYSYYVFTVTENKLGVKGIFENFSASETMDASNASYSKEIIRGTFIDDTLYTISHSRIKSFSLTTGTELGKLDITFEN